MKALKIIGYVIAGLISIVTIVILAQPSHGHVEKSVVINSPAFAIFPYLKNFKKENEWSPWTK
ncbi:MAG: GNAT family N-acetyltransferase, partial [Cyclobacteriaceae bacterium]|nr:GNAT family N-acetyltransferase [Cyclobacteriaceae bacterium]